MFHTIDMEQEYHFVRNTCKLLGVDAGGVSVYEISAAGDTPFLDCGLSGRGAVPPGKSACRKREKSGNFFRKSGEPVS